MSAVKRRKQKLGAGDRAFNIVLGGLTAVSVVVILYPLIFVLVASISDPMEIFQGNVWLWPKGFNLEAYKQVFRNGDIFTGYKNTLIYTVVGTLVTIIITFSAAYGDRALINVESNVQMTGVAVITTANKYPEATMRWLDYFYSEEGTVLCRLGIEGESYEVVDGKYQLLDNIKNNPDGLTLDQALGQWAIFPGGYLPQYITNEVDQSAAQLPETKAANDVVRDYVVPFETVPRVKFTEEESIKLGTYAQDIVNYATENVVKFITGEKSLSEWDAYVAELNNMPVEDYIKINQDAYDRWKG